MLNNYCIKLGNTEKNIPKDVYLSWCEPNKQGKCEYFCFPWLGNVLPFHSFSEYAHRILGLALHWESHCWSATSFSNSLKNKKHLTCAPLSFSRSAPCRFGGLWSTAVHASGTPWRAMETRHRSSPQPQMRTAPRWPWTPWNTSGCCVRRTACGTACSPCSLWNRA